MKQAAELIPAAVAAFKREIQHLKGTPATDANKAAGREIIAHHVGRLQMLDLSLSQQDARDILAAAYRTIQPKEQTA
jgi:hypothetical protein